MKRFLPSHWFGLIVILSAALMHAAVYAQSTPVAAERLTHLLKDVQTIEGRFSQLILDATGTQLQESSGWMILKRPGMFRWHTEPPMAQELVSNGEKVWLYDPDLMQVTIQMMDERVTHTPALLLSGDLGEIQNSFTIEMRENQTVIDFILTPKAKDTLFDRLRLSFNRGVINDMQLEDAVGQRTNLFFSDIKMNQPVDDDVFIFTVPEGVDVIEE